MRTSSALTQTAGDRASHPTTVQIDNVISSDDDCVITGESAAVVAEKSLHTSYYWSVLSIVVQWKFFAAKTFETFF